MLAQADHNNMEAPSKKGLKEKWWTRRCISSKFNRFSREACPPPPPRTSLEFFGPSRTRNKGHVSLLHNLQQISHSLEALRLERSVMNTIDPLNLHSATKRKMEHLLELVIYILFSFWFHGLCAASVTNTPCSQLLD